MHDTSLFLSHWDASIPVRVSADVVNDLRNYHIMGVRFLYDCFRKGQKGAILNHESGMNQQIQIAAFFNALNNFITPQSPVLVVCLEESMNMWHYHLTNHGGHDVTLLSINNCEEILQGKIHRVILSTIDNVALLREIKETDFFSVVVDELDQFAKRNVIKQLKSQFNIGVTNWNSLKNPDQKLFWTMLNWSNPEIVGKFADFCSEDNEYLENLRYPYGAWWQRLTWNFCESFKPPTGEEQEKYRIQLKNWSRQRGNYSNVSKPNIKRQTRKRKAELEDDLEEEQNIKQEEEELQDLFVEDHRQLEKASTSTTKNILKTNPDTSSHNLSSSSITGIENNLSQNLNSSQETVIYNLKNSPSDDDDNPILTIMSNSTNKLEEGDVKEEKNASNDDALSLLYVEPKREIMDDGDDDILTSIISSKPVIKVKTENQNSLENNSSVKTNQLQNSDVDSTSHKNDILSLLYGDVE